jgi:integrase
MAKKSGLGVLQIEKLIREGKKGAYSCGGSVYLSISKTKTASWLFRYKINGKARWKGMGAYSAVNNLAKARRKALAYKAMVSDGIDPIESERALKAAAASQDAEALLEIKLNQMTFIRCAEEYIEAKRSGWKNKKHAQQWESTLKAYAYPVIGHLPVRDITNPHLLEILTPIWTTKLETATRVRNRVELVLGFASALGYRSKENPAQWRGNLEALLSKPKDVRKNSCAVRHHPALPYKDMPQFMAQLIKEQGLGAMALRLTILTAVRTSEAVKAEWSEFDLDKKLWTIPKGRMKKDVEHKVPLTDPAIELLKKLKTFQVDQFVFPGAKKGKPLSTGTMSAVLKRMKRTEITVHGFRSTFRTWVADKTNFPDRVAEVALAHKLKDGAEASYNHGKLLEKRIALMEAWTDYCLPKTSNVSRLRA